MGRYLVIISASDNTGYTYSSQYAVSEINEHTFTALKDEFKNYNEEVSWYLSRGAITTIDLDELYKNFTPRHDKNVLDYIKTKEEELDEERQEYERLKAKYESN
jgi:phage-related minor tail protein